MKKLYIHDDGSVTCVEHAPVSVQCLLEKSPKKKTHWTPRGTWELATAEYAEYFKSQTGIEFDCEECSDWLASA